MNVWDRIDKLLARKGMQQKEVAAIIGATQENRYAKFKNGEAKPKVREMWAIARALGVPLDWLLDDDGPDDPPGDGLTADERVVIQAWREVRGKVEPGAVAAMIGAAAERATRPPSDRKPGYKLNGKPVHPPDPDAETKVTPPAKPRRRSRD